MIPEFNGRLEKRGKSDGIVGKGSPKNGNDFHHRIKAKTNVKSKGKVKSAGWAKSKPKGKGKSKVSKAGKGRLGR